MIHFARWKIVLVVAVCTLGFLYAMPNLLGRPAVEAMASRLPSWLPTQTVNLGLDLQGGSHLLLEVDVGAVLAERMETIVDNARSELREAGIGYVGLGVEDGAAVFTVRDAADLDRAREIARGLDAGLAVAVGDDRRVSIRLTEQALAERKRQLVDQSIEIVRRRIDETGTREPSIQRQGEDRILVQLPGVDDPEQIKRLLGKTAKLTFRFVDETVDPVQAERGIAPPGSEILPEAGRGRIAVQKRVMVTGDTLVDAHPDFQQGAPAVAFRFDTGGAKRFAEATRDNVGRRFAIVLDNEVISAPVIRSPILGGSGVIEGRFTVQEAQDLALLLRAGALPAPLQVLEERTVGPGLGADSIEAGKIASYIGFAGVVAVMIVAYGLFGVMAVAALLFNIALIFAALSVLQATLTLPGIAGIVLTVGMAVDANVLIFERMREEMRAGRSVISAIDAGYSRALSAIIDGNLTTLIAAVLLYIFGSGPIRGFAVTLSIGILTSMFTAIMVTRLMVVTWLRRARPRALPI